jgi:hypothetical protein
MVWLRYITKMLRTRTLLLKILLFIENRLKLIMQELDEQDVESFKESNKLTDIESEAKIF